MDQYQRIALLIVVVGAASFLAYVAADDIFMSFAQKHWRDDMRCGKGGDYFHGLLSDFSFSGYKVEPVAIKCESDDVEIGGEVLNTAHYNEIEKWKKFFFGKKLTRARMKGANTDPEERKLRSELQDVCHHIDKRAHRWENLRILELIVNSTASSFANAFANWERRCVKRARKTHLSSLMPS